MNCFLKIKSPYDVKKLNDEQLEKLCTEIREKLVETVSVNGGHLSPNLGVVELTVALERSFNLPKDSIGMGCRTSGIYPQAVDRTL